jgi:hypothetical protein
MARRTAWWAVVLVIVSVSVLGWRQWRAWNTVVPLEPARAEVETRPTPAVFHVDGGGRPATLRQMVQEADAVVVARMDRDGTDEIKAGAPSDNLAYRTGFHFIVVEVVRGDLRDGDAITIWRMGMREDQERHFPRPILGETFVFFLTRDRSPDGYRAVYGKYGTYRITDGLLRQFVPHPTTSRYEGKPVEEVLADLKALSTTT